MRGLPIVCLIATLSGFSSCAKNVRLSEEESVSKTQETISLLPSSNPTKLIYQGLVQCLDPNACEPAVGLLSGVKRTPTGPSAFTCSATLVGQEKVLTASHCIPEHIKIGGANCDLIVQFPGRDKKFACDKLVWATKLSEDAQGLLPDVALFSLKESPDIKPVPISRAGNEGSVRLIKIETLLQDDQLRAYQTSQQCKSAPNTIFNPQHRDGSSAVLTFGDCPTKLGDSGGAILTQDGRLSATMHAILSVIDDEKDPRIGKFFRELINLAPSEPLPTLFYASNLTYLNETLEYQGPTIQLERISPLKILSQPPPEVERQILAKTSQLLSPWIAQQIGQWTTREIERLSIVKRQFSPVALCRPETGERPKETPIAIVRARLNQLYQSFYHTELTSDLRPISPEEWFNLETCESSL